MKAEDRALLFPEMARLAGHPLPEGATVLDFGCGEGWKLLEQRKLGYRAFGMDVRERQESALQKMMDLNLTTPGEKVVHIISLDNYRIPFEDRFFDFMYSDHVMEHVQNLDESFAEMRRILKPGGIAIHVFPTRWRLFEAHTKTPFGGAVRSLSWLNFWSNFRLPERFRGCARRDRAQSIADYLAEETNYPTAETLLSLARKHFDRVELREDLLMRAWGGVPACFASVPGAKELISSLHVKALVLG